MACDYRCPYCGNEIEDPDYWEMTPEYDYEVECPECEREFQVSFCLDPVFSVKIPEELKDCPCDCDAWDSIDGFCCYGTEELKKRNANRARIGLPGIVPMSSCPLGHGGDA